MVDPIDVEIKSFRKSLTHQMKKCREIVDNILDETGMDEESQAYYNITEGFENLSNVSINISKSLYSSKDLIHYLQFIFFGIELERGYYEKKKYTRGSRTIDSDNILSCHHWFKTYSVVVLENPKKLRYDALPELLSETIFHHGPTSREKYESLGAVNGLLLLVWYYLEDILERWYQIVSMPPSDLQDRIEVLEGSEMRGDEESKLFGFINTVWDGVDPGGFITSYKRGQGAGGTKFFVDILDFIPSVGDVVEFCDRPASEGRKAFSVRRVSK